MLGFAIEEQSFSALRLEPSQAPNRSSFSALSKERFPHVHEALPAIMSDDFDARFLFGVDLLVHGLEHLLDEPARRPPAKKRAARR